jgi:hypothetical protein
MLNTAWPSGHTAGSLFGEPACAGSCREPAEWPEFLLAFGSGLATLYRSVMRFRSRFIGFTAQHLRTLAPQLQQASSNHREIVSSTRTCHSAFPFDPDVASLFQRSRSMRQAPQPHHPSKAAKRRFTSERACGHRLIGGALHRSASSALQQRFGSPRASFGQISSSVEQVEHSIVAIFDITDGLQAAADRIVTAFGCNLQVSRRIAAMQI